MSCSAIFKLVNNPSRYLAASRLDCSKFTNRFQCSRISTVFSPNDRDKFCDVLPYILDSFSTNPILAELPEVCKWIKTVLEHNIAGAKLTRGLTTVHVYETLEKPEYITEESLRSARILGWCIEVMQVFFLILDDILDDSMDRRGKPCWHRQPGVGLGAGFDVLLIQSCLNQMFRTYLGHTKQYMDIVELFQETILITSSGKHLDFTMANHTNGDYTLFTPERYNILVNNKTAYYTFRLPVFLGMILANIKDMEIFNRSEEICMRLGRLFQMQDDFLDLFNDESEVGTDIQVGKCTWLAVTALQRCDSAQRALFEKCYSTKDPLNDAKIKQLYEQLELPKIYREEEKMHYDSIVSSVHSLSKDKGMSPKLFLKLLDMIYNRKR